MHKKYVKIGGVQFVIVEDEVRSLDKFYPMSFVLIGEDGAIDQILQRLADVVCTLPTEKAVSAAIAAARRVRAIALEHETAVLDMSEEDYGDYAEIRIKGNGRMVRRAHQLAKMRSTFG